MKVFVILLVLVGFTGIMLATEFAQNSYAITLGMSSEQILENHQLIILGHIDSVETSSGQTEYTISVLDYIKYPDKFEEKETIQAVGCAEGQIGGCITFDKDQNVLFPLNEKNGILYISEVSFVAPNPYCTTNDLFALNDANHGLETSQNNQTTQFFTGQPIDITFYAYNKKLDDSSYNITIEFFRANNNTVFSKTFEGKFEECVSNVNLETSFTPTEMGKYGKRYTASYGGGELSWGFPIIEKGATPLKQFKSSISIDKIQCKENLVLIQKYDDSPACVTESTKTKLVERGWTQSLLPCTSDRTACFNQESNMCDPSGWECGDNGEIFSEIISIPESKKSSNTFPNISDRNIQITIGNMKKSQNFLSVMVFEESQRHTSANSIMFHRVTPLYSGTTSSDDPLYEFFEITSGQQENIAEEFTYVPTSTTLIAGEDKERFSVHLPIKIPLKPSVNDSVIQFNYSLPYISKDSDDVYSFKLLSLSPADINIPSDAKIMHNKTSVVSGFWFFDKTDDGKPTHTTDEYNLYYGATNLPVKIRDLLVYDIKFKLE